MAAEADPDADVGAGPGVAILLIDDNAGKRLAIQAILGPLGHVVVEADSGEAALRAVMVQPFAVILLDVHLPDMSGYETAALIRLRQETEHTPIIFITAEDVHEADMPVAYASGAVDFMITPLSPDILRAKVSVFVELFRNTCELERSLAEVTALDGRVRDSETRSRAVLEHVADGIVTVSDDGVVESFNRAACEMFGYEERAAIGRPFAEMVVENGDEAQPDSPGALGGEPPALTGRRQDGSTFSLELDLSDVTLGERTVHIGCLRDVSERRLHTEALEYHALHDDLTGLPNRVLFGDRVGHAIQVAVRSGEPLAVLLLDLDGFKKVNDALGHHYGDVLLQQVARRIVGLLRDGDTVGRLGGDEFGILPRGLIDLAAAVSIAWKLEQAMEPEFLVDGHAIRMGASVGIALVPEHGSNFHDVMRRADLAMYDAKRSGSGSAVFATDQEEIPARRLALLTELRSCVDNGELVLHFQPKIDLASGETFGVEALVRWNHPTRGLLQPADFIPEVERNELIVPITYWIVNEALRVLRSWRDEGYDLTMAVNLGARCLVADTELFARVDEMKARWEIPGNKLTFELTEAAVLDTAVPGVLTQLQEMDERLSIDDFGTGYSSLIYLQRLPVVEIKADRSFVGRACSVKDDAVIVRAIVDLAHNLGVTVVAEGVEDDETRQLLISYGCDAAQGYFFSRPICESELLRWLETSPYGLPRRLLPGTPAAGPPSETAATRPVAEAWGPTG